MSAAREELASFLSDDAWTQLTKLEVLHRAIWENHERVVRSLDEAVMADDRNELQVVWNEYRAVVANLSRVTEDIESLRVTLS